MSHQPSSGWAPPTGGDELRRLLISGLPADVKPRELLHIFGSCPGFESSALVPHMASVLRTALHCFRAFGTFSSLFRQVSVFLSCNRVELVFKISRSPIRLLTCHLRSKSHF